MAQKKATEPKPLKTMTRSSSRAATKKSGSAFALLLRGVNVGKGNALPMANLSAMLEKVGATNVRTYIQSGNAVFETTLTAPALTKAIESALADYMGRPIATTLRTKEELAAIVQNNPLAEIATNPAYLNVTFLSEEPTKSELAPLYAADFEKECFSVIGREIYTWHPNGQSKGTLAPALAKLRFRGAVTTRNWNTVEKLLSMLNELVP